MSFIRAILMHGAAVLIARGGFAQLSAATCSDLAAAIAAPTKPVAQDAPPSPPRNRTAQLPWWDRSAEKKIGNYWIKTDLAPEQANNLATHLNLMYREYARRLASLPPRTPERLNVMIFFSQEEYLQVLRTKFGINAIGTGGLFFVSPLGTGLAFWTGDLPQRRIEHVLQHEGFHQFAHSRFGGDLPPWLNEGLAEFFGEAVLVENRLVIGQTTPRIIDRIKEAIETKTYIPFQTMLTIDQRQWNGAVAEGNAALQYNQAWSMVHFLVYGDDGRYQRAFEGYLKLLNNGYKSDVAFIEAFGSADFEGFEQRWIEFAKQAHPSSFITAMERMEFLAEGMLALRAQDIDISTIESFDALREALQKIDFKYGLLQHGPNAQLEAGDVQLFTIPMDDLAKEQPVFVVEPADARRMTRRDQRLNEMNPRPVTLRTEHLKPHELALEWTRSEANDGWTYQIIVK